MSLGTRLPSQRVAKIPASPGGAPSAISQMKPGSQGLVLSPPTPSSTTGMETVDWSGRVGRPVSPAWVQPSDSQPGPILTPVPQEVVYVPCRRNLTSLGDLGLKRPGFGLRKEEGESAGWCPVSCAPPAPRNPSEAPGSLKMALLTAGVSVSQQKHECRKESWFSCLGAGRGKGTRPMVEQPRQEGDEAPGRAAPRVPTRTPVTEAVGPCSFRGRTCLSYGCCIQYHRLAGRGRAGGGERGLSNRNTCSPSSAGLVLQIKVPAGLCSLGRLQGRVLPASSSSCSCWWPQASLGLWQHHANLCLCFHTTCFPPCLSS